MIEPSQILADYGYSLGSSCGSIFSWKTNADGSIGVEINIMNIHGGSITACTPSNELKFRSAIFSPMAGSDGRLAGIDNCHVARQLHVHLLGSITNISGCVNTGDIGSKLFLELLPAVLPRTSLVSGASLVLLQ